ncbi:hypothetical protein HAX54_015844, partial [Datura stramonium]|nr:hypothetical protein [Datura stramonium]
MTNESARQSEGWQDKGQHVTDHGWQDKEQCSRTIAVMLASVSWSWISTMASMPQPLVHRL